MMRRIRGRNESESRIADENQEYQVERIDRYFKDIAFVKSYYQGLNKLVDVNGAGDPNTVLKRIIKALKDSKIIQ